MSYLTACTKHSQSPKKHGRMTRHTKKPINSPIFIRSCSYSSHFIEIHSNTWIRSNYIRNWIQTFLMLCWPKNIFWSRTWPSSIEWIVWKQASLSTVEGSRRRRWRFLVCRAPGTSCWGTAIPAWSCIACHTGHLQAPASDRCLRSVETAWAAEIRTKRKNLRKYKEDLFLLHSFFL